MGNSVSNVIIFVVGAAIGAAVTYKVVKTKYERLADEEIESVKETFKRLYKVDDKHEDAVASKEEKPDLKEYTRKVLEYGYTGKKEERKVEEMDDGPRVISPDEYGERYDYATVSLTYYADNVLEDEYGNVVESDDIDAMVGLKSLDTFGEYEDDSVFVINDELRTYYEILRDLRNYADIEPIYMDDDQ